MIFPHSVINQLLDAGAPPSPMKPPHCFLSVLLKGHPFIKEKKILWLKLMRVLLVLQMERNNRLFNSRARSTDTLLVGLSWCKFYAPFESYGLFSLSGLEAVF